MLTLWINCLLLQSQLGVIFWLPVIISLAIVVGGLLLNAFIAGKQFEKKADKTEVEKQLRYKLDEKRFDEFKAETRGGFDFYDDKFEEFNAKLDKLSDITDLLGRIDERVKNIQNNCTKQTCKTR